MPIMGESTRKALEVALAKTQGHYHKVQKQYPIRDGGDPTPRQSGYMDACADIATDIAQMLDLVDNYEPWLPHTGEDA